MHETNYRIKKKLNNFMEQHRTGEDDPLKMSIHSSSGISPQKKIRNHSQGHRYLDKYTNRSKKSVQTHVTSNNSTFTSKGRPSTSKKIVQFTNVKQLLMISAYDKKLLRNVTTSSEANQKFLRLGDVRKDPYRRDVYKCLIDDFKEWVRRIRDGYSKVIDIFLSQNSNKSAIVTLGSVKPLLEDVKYQANLMHNRVIDCQQTQDYKEFKPLLLQFDTFFQAAKGFEDIIYIVNESKNHIDDLFKNLEKDQELDKKVNKERKKGIKKVRKAVQDYGDDNIEEKILQKVQKALNEMADKTLQAYSKIKGVRGLIYRIKDCLMNNKSEYDLDDIVKINEIFKEALWEAQQFQKFSQKFMEEGDLLNDDLKKCINKYREEMQVKKEAICIMQVKFIQKILEALVQTLQYNYSICNATDSSLCQDYKKIQNLLESICEIISDETIKNHVKVMMKENKPIFRKIQRLLQEIMSLPKQIVLDRKQGYNQLVDLQDKIQLFKESIKNIIDRSSSTFKKVVNGKMRRHNISTDDPEIDALHTILGLSQKMNASSKKQAILSCPALKSITSNHSIVQIAGELRDIEILSWCRQIFENYEQICSCNQIGSILETLTLHHPIYQASQTLLQLYALTEKTSQSNLLNQAEKLKNEQIRKNNKTSQLFDNFYQKCQCFILCRGLQKRLVKIIDDPSEIKFPETQHDIESFRRDIRYFIIINTNFAKTFITSRINNSTEAMKQMIKGVEISQNLKWNKDELYYLSREKIFNNIEKAFQTVFNKQERLRVKPMIQEFENNLQNLQELEEEENRSRCHPARIEKLCQLIRHYKEINNNAIEKLRKLDENNDSLSIYSVLLFTYAEYLQQTCQSYHATLSQSRNVIWICEDTKDNPKISIFGQKIGLKQLKSGEFITKYNQKPILVRKQKVESKAKPIKPEKKPKKKHDDEIQDQMMQDEMQDDMQDDIGDDVEDEMGDDMEEDMVDEIDDEMGDDMQDDIGDQMGDDMQDEMEDQMGDDIEDEMGDQMGDDIVDDLQDDTPNDEMRDEIDEFDLQDTKKQKSSSVQQLQIKADNKRPTSAIKHEKQVIEQKAQQKKQTIRQDIPNATIKTKPIHKVHQIFKFIETLEDLMNLMKKLKDLGTLFWSSINFTPIQSYFNYQSRDSIKQNLISQLQKYMKTIFNNQLFNSNKQSSGYQKVLKQIENLDYLNFIFLSAILCEQNKKYSCLKGTNGELIRLSIQSSQEWRSSNVIKQYIVKQLEEIDQDLDFQQHFQFNMFKSKLDKSRNKCQTKYSINKKQMQPNVTELQQRIKKINQCVLKYQNISEFPDGMDLCTLVMKMWINCLDTQNQQDYDLPVKLLDDINTLKDQLNQNDFLYYIGKFTKQSNATVQKLQWHRDKLATIIGRKKQEHLLENIQNLIQFYKYNKGQTITYNQQPIFLKSTKTQLSSSHRSLQQLLNQILTPPSSSQNLTIPNLHNTIKTKIELFAQFPSQITKILTLLNIQSHIWASDTTLEIFQNKNDLLQRMVSINSGGVVTQITEELLQEIGSHIIQSNSKEIVWEYNIKSESMLSKENNTKFYKQFREVVKRYEERKNQPRNLSLCIIESVFGLQQKQNSKTNDVLEYIDFLSEIIEEEVFRDLLPYQTIFSIHQPTQSKLANILMLVKEEHDILEKVISPVDLTTSENCWREIEEKNSAIVEWYELFIKVPSSKLYALYLQAEKDKQVLIFITDQKSSTSTISFLLQLFMHKAKTSEIYTRYLSAHLRKINNQKFYLSQIFNWQNLFQSITSTLSKNMKDQNVQFVQSYNDHFFIKKSNQPKEAHQKIIECTEQQIQILKVLSENILPILQNQKQMFNFVREKLQIDQIDYEDQIADKEENLKLIKAVDFANYKHFGKWVIQVVGKKCEVFCTILMDKFSQDHIIAILPYQNEEKVKEELKILKLPTQFEEKQKKKGYQKIQLKQQTISVKIGEEISKNQIEELVQENYGLQKGKTLILGIFGKFPFEILLSTFSFKANLLQNFQKINVSLNNSVLLQIQARIIESKVNDLEKDQQKKFIASIFEENVTKVELGSQIILKQISKTLKKRYIEMKKQQQRKKKQEQARFLMQEEKRKKQEERLRKQQQARKLAEEEQRRKQEGERKQRQEEERKQRQEQEAKQKINAYLSDVYEKLAQNHIFTIPKQSVMSKQQGKSKKSIDEYKIVSEKNVDLRDSTLKVITEIEQDYEEDEQRQVQQVTSAYLTALELFILKRQEILSKVLQKAKQPQLQNISSTSASSGLNEKVVERIIHQLSYFPNYDDNLKSRIVKQLNLLSESQKQVLII